MSSISKTPDNWDFVYLELCTARMYGKPDDEVAKKHGFDSPLELYQRLNTEGIKLCRHCGVRSTDPFHCKEPEGKLRKPPRQKEQVVELPPAYDAAPLFKDALKALMREIEELRDRREVMQGERFIGIANKEYRGCWVYRREYFPDEGEWEEFCRECGEDPASEEISVPAGRIPTSLGALQDPAEPLTTLIAVYGLIKGLKRTRAVEVDPKKADNYKSTAWSVGLFNLVRSLNPDAQNADWAQNVDWEELDKTQKDLRRAAVNFAKMVRGSLPPKPGPGPEEVPPEYMGAVRLIKARQQGVSEEQIDQELARLGFTNKTIAWLKKQDLSIPAPPD